MDGREDQWHVVVMKQPQKILRRMPKDLRERIRQSIWILADNPFPPGHRKLVGSTNNYRIRVGDWRIVYTVENEQLLVLVIRIAPRGSAYQNL